jgi:hypothetical protein
VSSGEGRLEREPKLTGPVVFPPQSLPLLLWRRGNKGEEAVFSFEVRVWFKMSDEQKASSPPTPLLQKKEERGVS